MYVLLFRWHFDFDNILSDEKFYESIFIYSVLYKALIGAKPLRIRFDKVDEFIRVYDRTRYLALFGPEEYDAIYNRIRYLISQKSGINMFFLTIKKKSKLIYMILYL